MKHFLFTRINLPYEATEEKPYHEDVVAKSRKLCLDDGWLERRFDLFSKYCAPSVKGQVGADRFEWIIFMNGNTHRKWTDKFAKELPINGTVFLTDKGDLDAARDLLRVSIDASDEWIINTNLDCDDGISKNFIATIQKEARETKEFINIPRGYALGKDGRIYGRRSEKSPFRSLVEPINDISTVYIVIHGTSHKIAPIRQVETDARWLQVMHTENLTNKLARKSQDKGRDLKEILREFSIKP